MALYVQVLFVHLVCLFLFLQLCSVGISLLTGVTSFVSGRTTAAEQEILVLIAPLGRLGWFSSNS